MADRACYRLGHGFARTSKGRSDVAALSRHRHIGDLECHFSGRDSRLFRRRDNQLCRYRRGCRIAIGMAWSGLLSNFAAGAFIMVLRPFKVGDFVTAGGVTGTVKEIGLFVTAVVTLENVLNLVGNNKIFSDTIQNFSSNPYRRVDLKAQLAHSVDHNEAIKLLKDRVGKIPNVKADPAPDVEILEFNFNGPTLAVRPYCHTDH